MVDLLAYLRLLHNRYDDEALLTVLASPFVGVSNDALVLIRADAQRQPIFRGVERSLPGDLAERDRRLLLAFRQRYDRLLELAGHAPLEHLCERVLAEHDYDLAILTRADGQRRYANLRKLARLARSYEELRGADLEGFVRFVAGQEAVGAKESDAVSEEEGADAVRLLTIHGAKGLEFKVVVVADAGRSRPPVSDILALSDGRFGFKVAHPATGTRVSTESYKDVKEHRDRAEQAERLRLYYVAMTRAMERLIVSGSIGDQGDGADETPIGWVLSRLGAGRRGAARTTRADRGRARIRHDRAADRSRSASARDGGGGASGAGDRHGDRGSWRCSRARAKHCRLAPRGCGSSQSCPSRRSTVSRVSRSAGFRSSSGARIASTRSASPGCDRLTGLTGKVRAACTPPRLVMLFIACWSRSTSRAGAARRPRRARPLAGTRP